MKAIKFVIPFILGIAGGVLAFLIVDNMQPKNIQPVLQHEIVGPGAVRPVVHNVQESDFTGGAGSVDLRLAAKKTVPAVVNVKTLEMQKQYVGGNSLLDFWFGVQPQTREVPRGLGIGSGVIISEDGYIITNAHVLEGSDQVIVTLNDKREFQAKIIGRDRNTDIALLKIDVESLQPIEYGSSDDVVLGEWVLAVGSPYNLNSTVTAGIISAKARALGGQMNLESFLQTDAAVNPGNSGGALVNARGELIGINTMIYSPTGSYSGYSFAVPVSIVRKVVSDLKEYGKVQRAVFGISMHEVTPAVAKELKLKQQSGIYVAEVMEGGAARKAGIKSGDVIVKMNGFEVTTPAEFQEQLVKYNPGTVVQVELNRDGQMKMLDVTLQNSYGDPVIAGKEDFGVLGAKVAPLSKDDRYRYRLNKGVKIQELKNGKFKSAGLSEGYIILKINNTVVYDGEDLERALRAAGNEGVFVTAVSPRGRVEYFAFSLQN